MAPKVSVLVVGWNDRKYIGDCLASVLDQDMPREDYEVFYCDNASTDDSVAIVQERCPQVKILQMGKNLGYPAAMNEGLKHCTAPRCLMLSSDTVVPRGWLREMMRPMDEDPSIKVTHAAMVIPGDPGYDEGLARRAKPAYAAYHDVSRYTIIRPIWTSTSAAPVETLHVAGANALLDLSIMPELEYMLDGDFFLDGDEVDLGYRVNLLGYKVVAVPAAAYYHRHPFNVKMTLTKRLVNRLLRLQRNKFIIYYKACHLAEFLAMLPLLLTLGSLKVLAYPGRFTLWPRVRNSLGLLLV